MPSATLSIVDLRSWTQRTPVSLPAPRGQESLGLDVTDRWPIAWSPDGQAIYAITTTPSSARTLWRIDPNAPSQPVSAVLDYVPQRIDASPSGTAIFVLGGRTVDNTREGAVVQGSAFVAIYDPRTLAERVRVPLSGMSLGWADRRQGTLQPGVAMAPDGSRYFVAHADRPVLDVVDTRAPGLERLERTVSLAANGDASPAAWLAVTPDGGRLLTWRRGASLAGQVGLQSVDLKTWRVETLDPIAERLGWSVDRRALFELDPPAVQTPGAGRGDGNRGFFFRNPLGARLSVLDSATGTQLAVLAQDRNPVVLGQFDSAHLFATYVSRQGTDFVAYDTRSWQTLAERHVDGPGSSGRRALGLVTTTACHASR